MKNTHLTKKIIIGLSILFICNAVIANSDHKKIGEAELKVLYTLSFQPDSLNSDNIITENMCLLVGDKASMYVSYNNYMSITGRGNQPVIINTSEGIIIDGSNFVPSFFNYKIYKNYPEGKVTYTDFFPMDFYKYDEPMNSFTWEFTDERKRMGIYSVQKAITNYAGRTWEAWFTPDIPINDGPYKFHGLPGLILRIQDTRGHYVFEINKISTSEKKHPIVFPKANIINTDRVKFHTVEKTPFLGIEIISHTPAPTQAPSNVFNNSLELKFD